MKIYNENMNLIITPHIGGATIESINNTEVFIAQLLHKKVNQNN